MIATPNRLFGDDPPKAEAPVSPPTTDLTTVPPFIWPDARQHEETGQYAELHALRERRAYQWARRGPCT